MTEVLQRIMIFRRQILLIVVDGVLLATAFTLAFFLRFEFGIPSGQMKSLTSFILPVVATKLTIFYFCGLHRRMWRYVGMRDLYNIIWAILLCTLAITVIIYVIYGSTFPRSVIAIDAVLTLAFISGARFASRAIRGLRTGGILTSQMKPILIVGASASGETIIREILRRPEFPYRPVGLIDDDIRKRGLSIHGIRVLGTRRQLKELISKYQVEEVFVCAPAVSREVIRDIFFQCQEAGVVCKTLPGIHEIIDGTVSVDQVRQVEIEDILGREPARVDLKNVASYITGSSIAVTGAGGTIGSELCRQISRLNPSVLLMIDQNEGNLFQIQQELLERHGFTSAVTAVGNIANRGRMKALFDTYSTAVVFHAAAHKHVPMMELNLVEAIENNLLATKALAEACIESKVERFVAISTDKAVEPVSVMGITKALAEKIVQVYALENSTKFINVRFGNVLDSSGSVVPIFRQQIARGGPITVTNPNMTRYFMTITEAVQLVILAGAVGRGGETFVLDMGDPVSILELARNMIRLSGLEIDNDIAIEFTGTRPGEKMQERLFWDHEDVLPTEYERLLEARNSFTSVAEFKESICQLESALGTSNTEDLKNKLLQICHYYLYTAPDYVHRPHGVATE